jgi:hypothetical protein
VTEPDEAARQGGQRLQFGQGAVAVWSKHHEGVAEFVEQVDDAVAREDMAGPDPGTARHGTVGAYLRPDAARGRLEGNARTSSVPMSA